MSRFSEYIRHIVSVEEHLDLDAAEVTIRKNIYFRGPNVFILACAIVIASLGLNVNSIPVIIGAMLISPLMGPIVGFGLGLAVNDPNLLKDALKNLAVMVVISIIASTLYFLISPLNLEHPTELLARTNPTIYDVLIALFGGAAGMFEYSRKEHGTVLSGVSIATALMPPLCTVGFGIATLDPKYILGALYLFLINSVFISLAVFVTAKYLGFHASESVDAALRKRRSRIVAFVVVIMVIPSVWSAISVVNENNFSINAEKFVLENKNIGASYIYDHKVHTEVNPYSVEIFLAGENLNPQARELLLKSAESHGLLRSQVVFREEAVIKGADQNVIVRDIYEYYDQRIEELNKTITDLRLQLARYKEIAGELDPPADSSAAIQAVTDK